METPQKYRILVIDNSRSFFDVIRFQIEDIIGLSVVQMDEAHDGAQALAMSETTVYDLIFLDMDASITGATDAIKMLKLKYPQIDVTGLSLHSDPVQF